MKILDFETTKKIVGGGYNCMQIIRHGRPSFKEPQ